MEKPAGKIILVTGASAGIGLAITRELRKKGHIVYGTSRMPQEDHSICEWLELDVSNQEQVLAVVKHIIGKSGKIDVLVNNAGIGMLSSLEEAPIPNVTQVMDTNFYGVLRMIQAVLPFMREQRSGKVINISSVAGLMGLPYRSIYCASKFAVEALTESLRLEVARFGIQACSLQPGSINTDIKSKRVSHLPDSSPYQPNIGDATRHMDEELSKGLDANQVAQQVVKIVEAKRIKSKYIVANKLQVLGATLKRWLPASVFENMIRKKYRL